MYLIGPARTGELASNVLLINVEIPLTVLYCKYALYVNYNVANRSQSLVDAILGREGVYGRRVVHYPRSWLPPTCVCAV